ncbi:MAG: TonB-dependent receptor plug domain-containing protein, partial [Gemmatimonadales bacterium]
YSLILADGLPLYGGQAGGLGLLQIPPVDLGRVEIIKGSVSALYGSAALGGVVNLVSRRPGSDPEATLILNQTSRGGSDAVFYAAAPLASGWGYSLLMGGHRQSRNDLDDDGWTDMPGYRRAVVRPRFYYTDGQGRTAFVTAGFTAEQREGGTLPSRTAPDGMPFVESLRTYRGDLGGLVRWVIPDGPIGGAIVSIRGSAMEQRHAHRFGTIDEDDRHRTIFAEAAVTMPRRSVTYVAGAAFQRDGYEARDVTAVDYSHTVPAAFAQIDFDPSPWIALSASGRVDRHNVYGSFLNPRLSLLLRKPAGGWLAGWTARLSAGTGTFAPTPFTETTEVTGLAPLLPLDGLVAEQARNLSLDVGGPLTTPLGTLELNGTLFGSSVRDPVQVVAAAGTGPGGAGRLRMINASGPSRVWGGEVLARLVHRLDGDQDEDEHGSRDQDPHGGRALRITATYTHLRATECQPDGVGTGCVRRVMPLTPRHAVGMVASIEDEGKSRFGLELYYTGKQQLDHNPYRQESRPYLVVGLLAEQQVGSVRVFVNAENLANVRQTRVDPLVLPSRGEGGRWTTDVWSLLEGRTINGGVRIALRRTADAH